MANKNLYFNQSVLNQKLEEINKKLGLKSRYVMSTSGDFFVIEAYKGKKKFIIKIRRNRSQKAKKDFIKEITFFKYLSTIKLPNSETPKNIWFNIGSNPEYLIYSYISSHPLNGYYFYIGRRRLPEFWEADLGGYLAKLHQHTKKFIKSKPQIKLMHLTANKLIQNFLQDTKHLKLKSTKQATKILINEKRFVKQAPLVLSHQDFNPKNILIKNKKISVVDWSDLALCNPLYDLAFLSLSLWEKPQETSIWIYQVTDKIEIDLNRQKLFLINKLLILPRFIRIIEDSIIGIKEDYKKKRIKKYTFTKINKIARQALKYHHQHFEYLINTYQDNFLPSAINTAIEKFSNTDSMQNFLKQQQKTLRLKKTKIINKFIHKRDFLKQSKRLIVEYQLPNQSIITKIKLEGKDDLAQQSHDLFKAIADNPQTNGLAPYPLHYYPQYKMCIYRKLEGKLFQEIKLATTSTNKLAQKIARALTNFHTLNRSNLPIKKLISSYNTKEQISALFEYHRKFKTLKKLELAKLADQLLKIYEKLPAMSVLIHGDLQPQNIVVTKNKKIGFIDCDNSLFDDPLVDIGNLLVQLTNTELNHKQVNSARKQIWNYYQKHNHLENNINTNRRLNFYLILGYIKNFNFHMGYIMNPNFPIALEQTNLLKNDIQQINKLKNNLDKPFNKIINYLD